MVAPAVLLGGLEIGRQLIERFVPDKEAQRKAEAEFLKLAMDGELKQVLAQLEINAREAQHPSIWTSGWRPGAGWAGVAGLVYATIVHPSLAWAARIHGWPEPPEIDNELLWVVLTGMLGIGGLRTYEKKAGVASR